ncbi:MAG: phospholipase [Paludibacteraceae bacterium]|nr:phospholipase [Paludibacteraceae bacterium]
MSDLYYLLAFVAVCCIYYFLDKRRKASSAKSKDKGESRTETAPTIEDNQKPQRPDDCCGAHEVCEKESLINSRIKPEYYDDEELDAFVGRTADSYDEDEIRQFSDVFYTLKDYDVAGWLKSLQTRNVELPESLRDEALLIVQERRYKES